MTARRSAPRRRRVNAQQEFLGKPDRQRRRSGTRQHRQAQAQPQGAHPRGRLAAQPLPRISAARAAGVALVAGLVAVLAYLFGDPGFYVQTAAISGLRYASPEEVYRQAGIDQYSIFWVDAQDVARRIEQLPYTKRATVHTALPNQVRIAVEEREPVAVWKTAGQAYWVDSEGITMPVASQVQSLPVLWDLDGSTVARDGRPDRQLIASLHQVKQQVPEVTDFGYDASNGLQFRLPSGTVVFLGRPEGMAQRVTSLLVLYRSLASQGRMPAEINWRVDNGLYLRLAP